jgi:hypothetical protein
MIELAKNNEFILGYHIYQNIAQEDVLIGIERLESYFQRLLPKDYKYFLIKTNGGLVSNIQNPQFHDIYFTLRFLSVTTQNGYKRNKIKYESRLESMNLEDIEYMTFQTEENEIHYTVNANISYKHLYFCYDESYPGASEFLIFLGEKNNKSYYQDYGDISTTEHIYDSEFTGGFTQYLKERINDNGGYIKNLSEIYEDMLKQGF